MFVGCRLLVWVGGVDCCLVFASLRYVLPVFALCGKLMLIVAVICVAVVAFVVGVGCVVLVLGVECVLFPVVV